MRLTARVRELGFRTALVAWVMVSSLGCLGPGETEFHLVGAHGSPAAHHDSAHDGEKHLALETSASHPECADQTTLAAGPAFHFAIVLNLTDRDARDLALAASAGPVVGRPSESPPLPALGSPPLRI